jgi:hypothetical protein
MTILVIAEHDQQSLKAATLNTVTAAQQNRWLTSTSWSPAPPVTPLPSKPPACKA